MLAAPPMRKAIWSTLILAGILAAIGVWWIAAPRPLTAAEAAQFGQTGNPDRGRLVFAAGDFASCHASPGQSDRLHLGGRTGQ